MIEFKGKQYDNRHGGAFDRGAADSYYSRERDPHFFLGGTYMSAKVIALPGSDEHDEYLAGYFWNEEQCHKKEY